jgi:hypothetical protein
MRDNSEIHHLYECEICGGLHRWEFSGDCRDDANRFADEEDFARRISIARICIDVHSMTDRVASDAGAPPSWALAQ